MTTNPEPLSNERLAEIRDLTAHASPGPWTLSDDAEILLPDGTTVADAWDHDAENGRLIAAAPTIVAELLAEVDRLRRLVETGRTIGDSDARSLHEQARMIERLGETNERLRAQLAAAGTAATAEGCAR